MIQTVLLIGVPTSVSFVICWLSYCKLVIVDYVSPSFQILFALILVMVNTSGVTGEISEDMRS